jgi:hypothetical protein
LDWSQWTPVLVRNRFETAIGSPEHITFIFSMP